MANINISDLRSTSESELDDNLQELSEQDLNLFGGVTVAISFIKGENGIVSGSGYGYSSHGYGFGFGFGGYDGYGSYGSWK
ncbi:hypothetical protein NIES4074_33880 [Cylindrospermum sp. NIES-4074]|nr:hypothetical protein NIES4074_33880 [Cylindrospermum sp. NIES-4074]